MQLDPRILNVAIEIDGKVSTYKNLPIKATGSKLANTIQSEFSITIYNLSRAARDHIINETSPLNLPRKRRQIILYAGRQSYGTFKVFEGDIVQTLITQPPDIALTIKARTGFFFMGDITSTSYAADVAMSKIAKDTAEGMGLTLAFEATDKNISNYNYSGAKAKQIDSLASAGNYNVFVDDDKLVVKNADQPLTNTSASLNKNSGMIGIPLVNEEGVTVKYLLDPNSKIGGLLTINSEMNPAANGSFVIFKITYELSNRDGAFYNVAECRKLGIWQKLI
ncbi:baseplate hub protein [Serratia microhaemolytica]|uniref:baseplate hub protein n=1 Tax=Serratia microhaemolytica TaxID=2675110 RepID=UPI000FDE87B7|nr:hypothetical protein [Serratia microhaemolytica]